MPSIRPLLAGALLAAASAVSAFPEHASAPDAAALSRHLEGRVFQVALADGTSWRLEYKANGYFFIDTSRGFRSSGTWRAEDGKLCGGLQGRAPACNEVRMVGDALYMQRDGGEIVQYVPR
ncbi:MULTISPECIES: hypothetical protein [unclassified Rubrivivax]|uniref:hypothetical protein n=1 Tax=unclassified Rubrivivax TaxID=2649762 RepID=UPI001E4155A5|nr:MULTISPECIES: hypothetical protein [unclassified Rubrivivax]MCC9595782.1 hypothetical protein [Rubrivivax sp. JA1055]MCC9647878.1 hypothetical protein [Rubrivivax sp. JA1029]